MSSNTDLEIKGNLRDYPLAELLVEIFQAKLNGSLRASNAAQKTVVYFDAGDVVFVVSNARAFRLYELLLQENKISKEELAAMPEFTNDLILKEHLLKRNILSKPEIDKLFLRQIDRILTDAFGWREGEWIFSPLVRIKGDIRHKVDVTSMLLNYARNLPVEDLSKSFKNLEETFTTKPAMPVNVNLYPEEAFVFSRFEDVPLSLEKIRFTSGLTDSATLRVLYILWLGGFISRQNWNSPFSNRQVPHILSANLSLKKDESTQPLPKVELPKAQIQNPDAEKNELTETPAGAPPEEEITLQEYLDRMEDSTNYYRFFEVSPDAPVSEIKRSYFTLARRFHPDLFHKEVDTEKHRQIQNAFTKIAQAYETLKNENTRSVYDYKMRKELAEMEKAAAAGGANHNGAAQKQLEQAKNDFDHGYNFLLDENYKDALPFLARAAHLAPGNARFRAFYGKALAADGTQKHKAEAELQAAVKLDPNNASIRMLLAEFFIQVNLLKRAEGELNRLLAIFPSNREARALLDSLSKR